MPTEQEQTRRKYKLHPFSERKRVVELYETGLGSKRIARMMGLDDSMVRLWVRCYRSHGLDALQPCYRLGEDGIRRNPNWEENERQFSPAYAAYSATLEPIASITRRYGLNYQRFLNHVRHYHPELVEQRDNLCRLVPMARRSHSKP